MNRYCWFDKFSWRYGGERKEAGAVAEGDPGTREIRNQCRCFLFFVSNNGSKLKMFIGRRGDSRERGPYMRYK